MYLLLVFMQGLPLPVCDFHEMLAKQEKVRYSYLDNIDYWDKGHDFDVFNYDIEMTVDIPNDSIWANVTITIEALSDTISSIPLNFDPVYTISSCKEGSRTLQFDKVVDDTFRIFLNRKVNKGETLSVAVSYYGKPAEKDGLFITEADSPNATTYVNAEPRGARHWIPCYDAPSDKAVFTQRITVPTGFDLVANGTLESLDKSGFWWTYTWEEHYPQPTYLIVFAASKHFVTKDMTAKVEGKDVPMRVRVLASRDVREKFNNTPAMVEYFSKIFPPYPFADEKYDQVHAPIGGAMENATCTFINTAYNWGSGNWDFVLSHELSHHWWGDWLTCATWADLWLNEGFATYCEALWWENLHGEKGYRDYVSRRIMRIYLNGGKLHPLYDPPASDLFGTTTYKKGGSVLHMMRQVLGDSLFFAGLKRYATDNANKSVITDDLQKVMEEVSAQDLDWFFDEWVYGAGHPRYEFGWSPVTYNQTASPTYSIDIAIAQTQNRAKNFFPFRMPLEIGVYSGGIEKIYTITDSIGYQRFNLELASKPDSVILDPYDKVLNLLVYHDNADDVPFVGITEDTQIPTAVINLKADDVFSNNLKIWFSQPFSQAAALYLYDASGCLVKTLWQGKSKDFHRVYPINNLTAGVYFLQLHTAGGESFTKKVVKVR